MAIPPGITHTVHLDSIQYSVLLSLAGQSALGRVLVVPNLMMQAIVLIEKNLRNIFLHVDMWYFCRILRKIMNLIWKKTVP